MFQEVFSFSNYCSTWKPLTITNDSIQYFKGRLGTSSFNNVFIEIYPYDPTSRFQGLEFGSDLTFMKNEVKICETDFKVFLK